MSGNFLRRCSASTQLCIDSKYRRKIHPNTPIHWNFRLPCSVIISVFWALVRTVTLDTDASVCQLSQYCIDSQYWQKIALKNPTNTSSFIMRLQHFRGNGAFLGHIQHIAFAKHGATRFLFVRPQPWTGLRGRRLYGHAPRWSRYEEDTKSPSGLKAYQEKIAVPWHNTWALLGANWSLKWNP